MFNRLLSRRVLLQRAGLLAGGSTLISLLAACQEPAPPAPTAAPAKPAAPAATGAPAAAPATPPAAAAQPTATPAAKPAATGGKTITMGMWQPVPTLNTLMTAETGNVLSSSRLVLRGLLFVDEQANTIGELAAEVPSLQNGGISADGKTITYKLRKGFTWHDGRPVTSADVRFTWELIMKPDSGVVSRYGYEVIQSVDTPDEGTVVLRFKEPFAPWQILFDVVVPKHVLEKETNLQDSRFNQEPIGFGPFKIVENVQGDHMTFEAYDGYWKGRPKIDRLFIRYFGNAAALVQSLKAKESDLAWQIPLSNVPELKQLDSQGITTLVVPAPNPEQYAMNRDEKQAPLFADKELRQALSLAVDRKTIIDKLLFGLAEIGINPWDQSPWQNKNVKPVPYDPNESKKVLEGLGWRPGPDGILVKDGKRLSFSLGVTSGNQLRENVQLLVVENFKQIGAEAVVKNNRSDTVFGSWAAGGILARGTYEMHGFSYPLTTTDPDIGNRFLCRERPSDENATGAQRYRYCNPEIDALFARQAMELDASKRRAIVDQIQEILHNEYSQIYLYDSAHSWGLLTRVKNFKITPFAGFHFNPHEWDIQ
ncbi:MAG TPA: peptide ABC transporter substrate-binding protein [Chloroflexota bacterium]|nr:peptide ABC transporter substrate-binding protein [Chloroflexota bacterium]